jgi:hypothetical protein
LNPGILISCCHLLYRTFNKINDFLTVALQKYLIQEIILTRKYNQPVQNKRITALKKVQILG